MSNVSFTLDTSCGSDRIREQLLDHEFLTQFIKRQGPEEYDISVNVDESISTIGCEENVLRQKNQSTKVTEIPRLSKECE